MKHQTRLQLLTC